MGETTNAASMVSLEARVDRATKHRRARIRQLLLSVEDYLAADSMAQPIRFSLSVKAAVFTKVRHAQVVVLRQVLHTAAYLAGYTFSEIATVFNRNTSTISHSVRNCLHGLGLSTKLTPAICEDVLICRAHSDNISEANYVMLTSICSCVKYLMALKLDESSSD